MAAAHARLRREARRPVPVQRRRRGADHDDRGGRGDAEDRPAAAGGPRLRQARPRREGVAVMDDDALHIWTVYRNPSDFPGKWVLRVHRVPGGPDPACHVRDTLAEIRTLIPLGLVMLP